MNNPAPSTAPTTNVPSQPPIAATGAYSDPGIEITGGSLSADVRADGAPIRNAMLKLYGPTLATTPTNGEGLATLGPLAVGSGYRLIVEAAGFATRQVSGIEIKKKIDTHQSVTLQREASVKGHVTAGGQPLAGVTVSDGLNSTLTDATGSYDLRGVTAGALTLTAAKTRFHTASRAITVAGQGASGIEFSLDEAPRAIYFDNSFRSGVPVARLARLTAALNAVGWQVGAQPPATEGVWVVVCPSEALSASDTERVVNFTAQGGKVVLLGEWGGFGGFRNPAMNALAHGVGLHFNPDLVREPRTQPDPEWLTVTTFQPQHPAVAGIDEAHFYQACSLFGLSPMTTLAQTSSLGYRVQDNAVAGAQSLIVAGPFKGGKAIAIGDASAFSDDDTDGDGVANIDEPDNLTLMANLLDW